MRVSPHFLLLTTNSHQQVLPSLYLFLLAYLGTKTEPSKKQNSHEGQEGAASRPHTPLAFLAPSIPSTLCLISLCPAA